MGKSKKKAHQVKHKYELTRHQLSRQQQHKRRQRIFLIVGISVISAVGGVLGGGWYRNEYLPRQETVLTVNGTDFSMGYYLNELTIQGGYYADIYGAEQATIYLESLAPQVEQFIEESALVRQAAVGLGIVVSNEDVKAALKESDPPLPDEYTELMRNELLIGRLMDEHFDKQTPATAPQRQINAMLLESEAKALEVRDQLVAGEDFATLAEEDSLLGISDFGWHPQGILTDQLGYDIVDDYAFSAEPGTLSDPLYDEERTKNIGYWLVKVTEVDEDGSGKLYHPQVMLLGSEAEAQEVRERILAGEDFGELADEYSQYDAADEGGDMGLIDLESVYGPLQEFVVAAQVGVLSEVIEDDTLVTEGAYWLVEVVATEDAREISEDDRAFLNTLAFSDWIDTLWENPNNEITSILDEARINWAIERAVRG